MPTDQPPVDELPDDESTQAPPPDEEAAPSAADDPELTEERNTRDSTWAPYRRFRDDPYYYKEENPPGSFSGDLIGCGFACRQCWSSYGLAGKDGAKWYSAEDAGDRLLDGARANGRRVIRVSNGEPFLYPDHLVSLAAEILSDGEPPLPRFQIETGGTRATPDVISRLNDIAMADNLYEVDADTGMEVFTEAPTRIGIWWSVKAVDEENWSWYTGRPPEEFAVMMANLEWALRNAPGLTINIGVIEDLMDEDEVGFQRFCSLIDSWRSGVSSEMGIESHRVYFPHEREIDRKMGQRRLKMAKASKFWGTSEFWDEENMLGNNICSPFPKPK